MPSTARVKTESRKERCQVVQGAPQSGAHLRGRNAQRVLARALRRGGRVVNDVVLAGADAEMKDHARLHRRCIMYHD